MGKEDLEAETLAELEEPETGFLRGLASRLKIMINLAAPRMKRWLNRRPIHEWNLVPVEGGWREYVQLLRAFPVVNTPAPVLHLLGRPIGGRVRAACQERTSAHGVIRWYRGALLPRERRLCAVCFPDGEDHRPAFGEKPSLSAERKISPEVQVLIKRATHDQMLTLNRIGGRRTRCLMPDGKWREGFPVATVDPLDGFFLRGEDGKSYVMSRALAWEVE